MDCLSEGRIQGIVEGGLDTVERLKAREHLENCSECRKLVGHAAALLASGEAEVDELEHLGSGFEPLTRGDKVGRYIVEERLGSGAMGVVYAATDSLLRRQVALKLLRPGESGASVEQARLEREAQAACAVKHPGVVAVHDVLSTADGLSVLVMDRLEGTSMRQYLRERGPLPANEVLELFSQILEALSAAHRMGIVHRDLKPENVFLTRGEDGGTQVKLLDFGVAKLLAGALSGSAGLTKSGTLVGTPYYMAPEQAFGAADLDQRADLWAVGVMLYEALVGERPLRGDNVGQVLHQLAHFDFGAPRARLLETAPEWEPLVSRLMVERAARLDSASQALELLRGIGHPSAQTAVAAPGGAPLTPKKRAWVAIPIVLGLGALLSIGLIARTGGVPPDESSSAADPLPTAMPTAQEPRPETPTPALPAPTATVAPTPLAEAKTPRPTATIPAPRHAPRLAPKPSVPAAPAASAGPPTASARKPRLLTEPPF